MLQSEPSFAIRTAEDKQPEPQPTPPDPPEFRDRPEEPDDPPDIETPE